MTSDAASQSESEGPVLAIGAVQIFRVNTTLLPPELRPSWWRRVGLLLCALFYGVISGALVWNVIRGYFGQ